MPAFLLLLLTTFGTWLLKNILPQMLISVGVGLVSYTGFSALDSNLTTAINDMGNTASSLNVLFHMFGVYIGIKTLLSAVTIKASLAISKRVFPVRTSS
ncbi:DUF2523 domain-containing protein [Acidithiobacillus thiooxidans]|uniref:DUF2523 family protein n=1 Tax=Acidithiobacillus TaxID=119977 RepID=UPI0018795230|nr:MULTISPECIES: DUF2523 family protein [Acidithiobacillus]MBE7567469.1 DUF2523 domain-containing protein [Acidithiobacillus sp. HP-11]MBU2751722.1 DUF2523 domain-containing protein [Acidithiobacillus thiooxidans]